MSLAQLNDAAITLLDSGHASEAAAQFRNVIQLAPDDAGTAAAAYFNLGLRQPRLL